jgi:hypothetical protein
MESINRSTTHLAMRRLYFFLLPLLALAMHAVPVSLFDSQTLTGWKPTGKSPHSRASGNKTGGKWRAEDGTVVGSQDTPNNGGLLITEEQFGDVEVTLEMRNDFGPDSGLFMRCTEDGGWHRIAVKYRA